jgi:hypothetical protein
MDDLILLGKRRKELFIQLLLFFVVVHRRGMPTIDDLWSLLRQFGKPLSSFRKGSRIISPQTNMTIGPSYYSYVLDAEPGQIDPATGFAPELTPGEMLMLGVFEGKYLNDCVGEFPADWFVGALQYGRLSPEGPDPVHCNFFGVGSRQPLSVWKRNGWAPRRSGRGDLGNPDKNPDERGWFQWYCRYWLGRRIPALDAIQIGRWRSFRRHAGAIRANCRRGDQTCRPRERQALLQWAYNPFI